jgi:hypothetical protein
MAFFFDVASSAANGRGRLTLTPPPPNLHAGRPFPCASIARKRIIVVSRIAVAPACSNVTRAPSIPCQLHRSPSRRGLVWIRPPPDHKIGCSSWQHIPPAFCWWPGEKIRCCRRCWGRSSCRHGLGRPPHDSQPPALCRRQQQARYCDAAHVTCSFSDAIYFFRYRSPNDQRKCIPWLGASSG